jgi:NAD(P)-dependent dehydrogenase (short-subunit alcohol dehydrogenase family)
VTTGQDPTSAFRLDDRVVVITGASAGLGARFAEVTSAAGAKVVLAARRTDLIEKLAHRLPDALALATDLSHPMGPEQLIDQTLEHHGRIDVLINNAGATEVSPALTENPDRFREILEINLVAPFLLARCAATAMIEQGGGSIVNVASINSVVASRDWPQSSYAASKGGLLTLTRELANQWGPRHVRVNALGPGYFRTEMTDDLLGNDKGLRYVTKHTPLRRHGLQHELDGPLLFLASDASSYMTGQLLLIDGGWTVV